MFQKSESLVETANRLVPLRLVLEWTGIYVPDFSYAKSMKTRCPYADMYHLTVDASKSMRIYPESNTGHCFMGCGTLTPVNVHARLNDLSYKEAALDLLMRIGHKPKTFSEKWQEAINPPEILNKEVCRDALLEYCLMVSGDNWAKIQYRNAIAAALTKTLVVLDMASSKEDACKWLESSKIYMYTIVRDELLCLNRQ